MAARVGQAAAGGGRLSGGELVLAALAGEDRPQAAAVAGAGERAAVGCLAVAVEVVAVPELPARGAHAELGVDDRQRRTWRRGPIGAPPRPHRRLRGASPIFTVRPVGDDALVGELHAPERVLAQPVAALLRVRRDRPGALVALEDGRYAVTGPLLIAGSREDVTTYARRRATLVDPEDRAWLQTVVGALAIDILDAASVHGPPEPVRLGLPP